MIEIPLYWSISNRKKKHRTIPLNMNWYRNAHYQESNKIKILVRQWVYLKSKNIPVFYGKVEFDYKIFTRNKASDIYNWHSVVEKFTTDALVYNGIIKSDNLNYVMGGTLSFGGVDKDDPRAELTIREAIKKM